MSDLIERMGREVEMYRRFALDVTLVEVSPEVDVEIKRLTRKRPEQDLVVLELDRVPMSYRVNPQLIGPSSYKMHTRLGYTPPEVAVARHFVNRSQGKPVGLK